METVQNLPPVHPRVVTRENSSSPAGILRAAIATFCLLFAIYPPANAQSKAPSFQDFPATEKYNGTNASLILSRDDATFRTQLQQAASQKPNFARHYILATWGCGAQCIMGAVIDANTGTVARIPFTLCCWADNVKEPIGFRLDSRLIRFTGERNEQEHDKGHHFYEFKEGKFAEVSRTK